MAKKEPIRFEDFFPSAPEMAAHRDKPKKTRLSLEEWNSILDDYHPMDEPRGAAAPDDKRSR
jgi:hypothetical protein